MKRFTATEKWSKEWFQELPCRLKCLWQYLCDNADAAGVWDTNFRQATFCIGEKVAERDMAAFGARVAKLESGKWILTGFLEFQYGKLSQECRAHLPIFKALAKHGLSPDTLSNTLSNRVSNTLSNRVSNTLQDKEEETDKETEEEKDRGSAEGEIPDRLDTPGFRAAWTGYVVYRKRAKLKPLLPESVVAQWRKLSEYGPDIAVIAINDTISNGWQGIFPEKVRPAANGNGKTGMREKISVPIYDPETGKTTMS